MFQGINVFLEWLKSDLEYNYLTFDCMVKFMYTQCLNEKGLEKQEHMTDYISNGFSKIYLEEYKLD